MRLYTAFVVLFLLLAPIAHAIDSEDTRSSLRGLKGVEVIIDLSPRPEVEQNGLTASAIRTDVELKLRQAGIPVLATEGGNPWLGVIINVLPSSGTIWPYVITVELRQSAFLLRDSSILALGTVTWSVGSFGGVGKQDLRSVRDDAKDQVDKFINAYLAVNPKK
jgi:hypothetical protein